MIKVAVLVFLVLYFGAGALVFKIGIDGVGGKAEYKAIIAEKLNYTDLSKINLAYAAAFIKFVTLWPKFLYNGGN